MHGRTVKISLTYFAIATFLSATTWRNAAALRWKQTTTLYTNFTNSYYINFTTTYPTFSHVYFAIFQRKFLRMFSLSLSLSLSLTHTHTPAHTRMKTTIPISAEFTAMVTGNGLTRSYLHQCKIIPNSTCPCGLKEQTINHIILNCTQLEFFFNITVY